MRENTFNLEALVQASGLLLPTVLGCRGLLLVPTGVAFHCKGGLGSGQRHMPKLQRIPTQQDVWLNIRAKVILVGSMLLPCGIITRAYAAYASA